MLFNQSAVDDIAQLAQFKLVTLALVQTGDMLCGDLLHALNKIFSSPGQQAIFTDHQIEFEVRQLLVEVNRLELILQDRCRQRQL